MPTLKLYYRLMKPGIIYGNALTTAAGFFLASQRHIDWVLLVMTLLGISLIIASACVFNNYLDRELDAQMERTKRRALVTGDVSVVGALAFGAVLGLLGAVALLLHTSLLTFSIALGGFFIYVIVYGWAKRHTTLGVHIGALAGAVPPVVGYTAVTGTIDVTALALFMLLVVWQMPHFFSIALYRSEEYKAAGVYVLPHRLGVFRTKLLIFIYVAVFALAAWVLALVGPIHYAYNIVLTVLCVSWLALGLQGLFVHNHEASKQWAHRMFFYSLVVITLLSIMLIVS